VAWRRSAEFTAYCDEVLAALHHEPSATNTSARNDVNGDAA
jgi:hypothetical protein